MISCGNTKASVKILAGPFNGKTGYTDNVLLGQMSMDKIIKVNDIFFMFILF